MLFPTKFFVKSLKGCGEHTHIPQHYQYFLALLCNPNYLRTIELLDASAHNVHLCHGLGVRTVAIHRSNTEFFPTQIPKLLRSPVVI